MLDFERDVLPAVRYRAKLVFRRRPDRVERTNDAISVAWESMLTLPDGVAASSVAFYACKRVRVGRQFRQSARCLMGPNPRRRKKPLRVKGDFGRVLEYRGENPASLAAVQTDFRDWLEMLTKREVRFLTAFMRGDRTKDIARRMRVSAARVSQIRGELVRHWEVFTS